ncbi:Transmembrane and coiled-coil domain-containing protein 3 [Acropora cervicornis]|uniref:Transmembrane and coiled-coil domain-containing protein 3 n=1 Tax=Acropora cervicornis TaxID=6130 RepID=A0AAD9R584_ACRCE|nr:Transmembrane and coiled-coil domain-containing protein 3 [Acropora cervicornis]
MTRRGNLVFLGVLLAGIFSGRPQKFSPKKDNFAAVTENDINRWSSLMCQSVSHLFKAKERVVNKLSHLLQIKGDKQKLTKDQVKTIAIFRNELDVTERAVFDSLNGLRKLLQEDYKSVVHMKEAIKQRLEALKLLALQQEDQFNAISETERAFMSANKHLDLQNNGTRIEKIIGGILDEISFAADKLEDALDEKTFEKTRNAKGASIEAVVRLNENEGVGNSFNGNNTLTGETSEENDMSILVDSQNNQFVLAKSKDATVPHEDVHFIKDIIFILLLSFLGSCVCFAIHLPTMFAFVISGMVLGPSGVNMIKTVVQVETLGEFGVFFILFAVWKVAVGGSSLIMILMIVFGIFWGMCFGIFPRQSAFVAACLSLSSTPLVAKFVEGKDGDKSSKEHTNGDGDYTSSLLGILVMQDVHLGLLVALLPGLAGQRNVAKAKGNSAAVVHGILNGLDQRVDTDELTSTLSMLVEITLSFAWLLVETQSKELLILATVSTAFCLLLVNEVVEPLRDFFSCLFFASIGLHVFPTFVLNEFPLVLTLTLGVVFIKFVVSVFVLRLFLRETRNTKYIVAAGLAQVSEFSFVLGSRARRFHLISREVYLIILSVTTISLLLAPLLWRLSLWRFGSRKLWRSATSEKTLKRIARAI